MKLGELPGTADREHGDNGRQGLLQCSGRRFGGALDAQTLNEMRLPSSTRGVAVTGVEDGSTAQTAGLRDGDVIQEVNRMPVSNVADFDRAVKNAGSGTVLLLVNRNGFTQYVAIQGK